MGFSGAQISLHDDRHKMFPLNCHVAFIEVVLRKVKMRMWAVRDQESSSFQTMALPSTNVEVPKKAA